MLKKTLCCLSAHPIPFHRQGLGYEALSRISEDGLFSSPEELFIAAKEHNRLWELEQLARSISLKSAQSFMTPTISKKLFLNVNPHILQDDSFIRDIHGSPIKRAIVKGLVEFSTASRSMLIAEGVETFEELDCVLPLGVQYAQGYSSKDPKERSHPSRLKHRTSSTTRN